MTAMTEGATCRHDRPRKILSPLNALEFFLPAITTLIHCFVRELNRIHAANTY